LKPIQRSEIPGFICATGKTKKAGSLRFRPFLEIKFESNLKSPFAPKSPNGDFYKLLIFSVLPFGSGLKTIKISSLGAF